jgi:eukaryotic-like serine/threonine-protein kinase
MTLTPGTKFGPYEVVGPLGAGGMGEVYRARDTRLGRDVAIKILPKEMSADAARKHRFEREAKTISGMSHPNICTLHDVGSQDGVDYLVMECVEGETLAKRLEKGPLALEQLLKYGAQIADALEKAHRAGIVHRDLKPGNVMLTAAGAKLLDFGLAKPTVAMASGVTLTAVSPTSPATQEGTIVGTIQYMSPEQIEGKDVDGRSDIFSLGAVLYEMLTGKRAFAGRSQLSVASAILEKEPEPISAVKPMTPASLDRTIRKCLAKAPDERWQSASDLGTQLKWMMDGGEGIAIGVSASGGNRTWEKLGWSVSAVLLVALGGVGLAWWSKSRAPQDTTYYASPFQLGANGLALSPDGKMVAMVAYWDQGNKYMIWLYKLGELLPAIVEGTDGASDPFWSPDGQWIGFFAQGKLKKTDISGKSVQVLCDAANGRGGAWNKDGVIVFTPDVFTGLHRVSAGGGTSTEITKLDPARVESSHRWAQFLPDGKHFLYLGANFAGHFDLNGIFLGALDLPEKKLIVTAGSNAVYVEPGYLLYVKDGALVAQRFDVKTYSVQGDARVVRNEIQYLVQIDLGLFDASRNGTLIAQTGKGGLESQLTWFDRNGRKMESVGGIGSFANPSLSPDGKRVAYDQANPEGREIGVWIHDLGTDAEKRLTLDTSLNQVAVWSPDGKKVLFSSNRNVFNRMFEKNADGSGPEEEVGGLPVETVRQVVPWDWSQDGKYVLVRAENELWWYAPAEKRSQPYLQGKATVRNAQFSPDGKYVAYASNETGGWEVYVTPFPKASSKWQVSHGGGEEPRWRRDGKELFYLSPEGALMATKVNLGNSFEAMTPVALFQSRRRQKISSQDVFTYGVGDDGNRFLFNTIVDRRQATPLWIMRNWTAQMEK